MMGKRAVLVVFLSLFVIMSYNYYLAQKYPRLTKQASPTSTGAESELLQAQPAIQGYPAWPLSQENHAQLGSREHDTQQALAAAKDIVVDTDLVRLVITSRGASVKSGKLKFHAEEKLSISAVEQRLREIAQAEVGALPQAKEFLQREKAKQQALLARLTEDAQLAELVALSAVVDADFAPAIIIPEQKQGPDLNTVLYQCSQTGLYLSQDNPTGQLVFEHTDAHGRTVRKSYSFSNSSYAIGLDIVFLGWESSDFPTEHFQIVGGPNIGTPEAAHGRRMTGYQGPISCFQTGQQVWTQTEKYARQEQGLFIRREHREKGEILWAGLENKYFLSALIPAQTARSVVVEKNKFGEQKVALEMPWTDRGSYNFKFYLGPKTEARLKEVGTSLEKAIDYGFFGPIARAMYQILLFFSRWTHNFGWAIVLLCLVTKIVFYPLTHRSFESMQKMQLEMKSVQPEMEALRARLKDNPQKLNKEIMELYRKKGINPLASCQSGCLPMVLQMPVFFALYGLLYNSIELRGTPFIGWITDLSAKDPYYVLPILMGISMFAQQKLTGMGVGGGVQQGQAKMMAIMMPVMLTWVFASLPSGVVLYWLAFNILTALQQLLISQKQPEPVVSRA